MSELALARSRPGAGLRGDQDHVPEPAVAAGAYRRFRRLRRAGRAIPGLVEAHVRVASGATLLIFSVWQDELALIQFTTLESHVNAVRWTIDKRGEVWSGVFRLTGTSSMSKPWIGTIRHWEPLVGAPAKTVAVDEH